jgi:PAS domain S-box-containing protein
MAKNRQALVAVIAPYGKDAQLIAACLSAANISCDIFDNPELALPDFSNGTGALLVEEEVFGKPAVVKRFSEALHSQPSWSDSPLIVLTKPRSSRSAYAKLMARVRAPLGHATLLERPVRPEALVSIVTTALRARERQYQVRDMLDQLCESEERYRSLALATSSMVWAADPHGCFIESLPSWEAFTGQSFEQYRGRGWMNCIHPDDRLQVEHAFTKATAESAPFHLEFRLMRHDRQYRCVQAHGVPVFRAYLKPKEWVGTCTDIQEKKDAAAALRRSERLAMAGQFAATIAHEINNPLEAVTNLIYLIRTRSTEEQIRQFAGMAEKELTRVAELSGQTLRFYRKSTEPASTNVAEILESLLRLFGPTFARRKLRIEKNLRESRAVVAFPNELRQLFANMLSNAVDAVSADGYVAVRVRPARNWGDLFQHGVRITIADTGTGIPAAVKAHIFEPFVTTKGDSGTGLGLWVCSDIVRRHHGDIKIKSRTSSPTGTVFSIFLPYDQRPLAQEH